MPADTPCAQPGDRCPDFLLPPQDGHAETFHARHAGQPVALLLVHDAAGLAEFVPDAAAGALFALVAGAGGAAVRAPLPAMHDHGVLTARLGLGPEAGATVAWIVDAQLQLRQRLDAPTPAQLRAALAAAQALPVPPPVLRSTAAPVMILPGVLAPALCRQLLAAHAADHAASGMLRLVDGRPALVPDARAKQRLDHRLTDPALVEAVAHALSRRVVPEIATAFHYPVTRMEGFKVAAYDAGSGWFRLHRDNVTPDARHRRFAVTVALDDDFDGGALRFPEFGNELYRPPAGAAIVFSGSLLHEVTDVTRGRRHVLLTFLWGDDAGAG